MRRYVRGWPALPVIALIGLMLMLTVSKEFLVLVAASAIVAIQYFWQNRRRR